MNLIYYRGLHCHLACIVSIADSLGVNYRDAFGTLWSETDFVDDLKYHIYSSRRIIPNLEALGIKIEVLNCESGKESEESFFMIPEGELFLVGMDTYHIPWNPLYQHFREPHYFFAQKQRGEQGCVSCFDPTYNYNDLRLTSGDIAPHAFDLSRIRKLPVNPPKRDIIREARDILRKHPETREKLRMEIGKCKNKELKNITPLIKQINAMINNRYLFQRFLHQYPFAQERQFFDRDFFLRWEAVKNGLYKASIIRSNESVADEVCGLFMNLICEESDMANAMILMGDDLGFREI